MIRRLLRREKKLGSSRKRSYDIPLNKGAGAGFLTLLIALMTFLAVIALCASFVLRTMTERWSSGLENKVTIEIPSTGESGHSRQENEITRITGRIASLLENHPEVTSVNMLSEQQVSELVSPWLGEDFSLEGVPVPGLISVELKETTPDTVKSISDRIKAIDEFSRLDTHESWLNDLLSFAGALQLGAFLLAVIIGFTTVTAVGGAVRARMAVHGAEIELLHIMGASDEYITRQFQRHSMLLAVKGGIAGTTAGILGLAAINHIAGEMNVALLPDFEMHPWQIAVLLAMPLFAGTVAMLTARITVLKELAGMP
jgi:cell division transport system permease protein